jgi:hypothetical protein
MTLPPRAIQALILIKSNLLSTLDQNKDPKSVIYKSQNVMITLSDPPKMRKAPISKVGMRHAKAPNAYQRWKQHRENW